MAYIVVNLNLRKLTLSEIEVLEAKIKKRELADFVGMAVKKALLEINPDINGTVVNSKILVATPSDVEREILAYHDRNPHATEYELKQAKERLETCLSLRPFYLEEMAALLKQAKDIEIAKGGIEDIIKASEAPEPPKE